MALTNQELSRVEQNILEEIFNQTEKYRNKIEKS